MNVDQLGRQAGDEIRAVAGRVVPAVAMLDELRATHRRQRRVDVAVGVTLVLLVAAIGWQAVTGTYGRSRVTPIGPFPAPTAQFHGAATVLSPCDQIQECLGGDAFLIHLDPVPVSYRLPAGWTSTAHGTTTADLVSADQRSGVSLLEDIAPPGRSSGALTAESVARWLAARPFLVSGPVIRTTVAARPAWQVDVRLRAGQPAGGHCLSNGSQPCVPLRLSEQFGLHSEGIWGVERMRWTFLDLPNVAPAAVFSWTLDRRLDLSGLGRSLIDSIRFTGA